MDTSGPIVTVDDFPTMNETQLVMGMQNNSFVRSFVQIAGMTLTAIAVPIQGFAQTVPLPRPEFDAATIKPSRNEGNSGVRATTGRFTLEGVPLRVLVSVAYKTRPSQIIGGPPWSDSSRFDMEGEAGQAVGTDVMLLMLQVLLEDRFKLRVHRDVREGSVYDLTVAKAGYRLKAANCVAFDPNHLPRQAAPGEAQVNYCGRMSRGRDGAKRTVDARGVDINPAVGLLVPSLTGLLSDVLERPVINKTGLTGAFDFRLEWADSSTTQNDDPGAPSIFTALQEQLGLRLDAAKGPVDFLVIDSAEKPSEN